jgi:diguanylate cyclase (GGDEF)-like protein
VHDGTSTGAIALVTDVTDRHLLEERLEREARVDALTGVANRHTLFEVLARELARPELCGVLFADLDDFKAINDTYGHGAGDETLRVVAKRLSSAVREVDTVARVGGDEFVVVTSPLRSEGEALAIGDRIPRLLEEPVPFGRVSITVGLSVGIAFSTKDDDADTLLARADNAMYRAKRARSAVEVADR